MQTEPGLKFIKIRKPVNIDNWQTFEDFVAYAKANRKSLKEKGIKLFIIDTIDNLAKFAMNHICEVKGIDHPSVLEWGRGWELFYNTFSKALIELASLGFGVVMIGHATEKEVTYKNMKVTKTVPAMPSTCYRCVNALVDFIFYCGYEHKIIVDKKTGKKIRKEVRVLYTKATENIDAGDRTGLLPASIPLEYAAFAKLFYNRNL